jgi:hypothetical protein
VRKHVVHSERCAARLPHIARPRSRRRHSTFWSRGMLTDAAERLRPSARQSRCKSCLVATVPSIPRRDRGTP